MEEVIDLDLNHLDNDDIKSPSVDFGGGIELLMNDKKTSPLRGFFTRYYLFCFK